MSITNCGIEILLKKYPMLEISECDDGFVCSGEIVLNHVFNDVRMTGKFNLEIVIPNEYPSKFPKVKELSNLINKNYAHRYKDGYFCLASDLELKLFFSQNNDIYSFVENYVIPYLYTYRFYEKYGVYPYGERSHGVVGNLEYFKDLFEVNDFSKVLNIMSFITQSSYRGHLPCPCESGKKIRNCHGVTLKKVIDAGLKNDCATILLEIKNNMMNGVKYGKYN